MLVEKLPVFIQSGDLEVQERACCILQVGSVQIAILQCTIAATCYSNFNFSLDVLKLKAVFVIVCLFFTADEVHCEASEQRSSHRG